MMSVLYLRFLCIIKHMTKYILNSGGLKSHPEAARAYFAELLDGLGNEPKLLWCFFATLPDDTNVRFKKYTKLFEDYYPKGVHPISTNAKVDTFAEQVVTSDAIYMHGGSIKPLYDILKQYDLIKLFKGKHIGTNSASSMVLAKHAWSCDKREPDEWLGIFPIKFLAHYKSSYGSRDPRGPIDWDAAYEDLAQYGDTTLPIHALKEGEFIVKNRQ